MYTNEICALRCSVFIWNQYKLLYSLLPILTLLTQYGFILYQEQNQRSNGGGEESVFFHMNSLTGSCEFSDLRPGDEVEFLMTYNQRTHKHSAIHVKKLRWGDRYTCSMISWVSCSEACPIVSPPFHNNNHNCTKGHFKLFPQS